MDKGETSIHKAYKTIKPNHSRTFKITLYKNPKDDAEVLLSKGGREYCTKLAQALLVAAGHKVDIT